jgi:hypothetical protein
MSDEREDAGADAEGERPADTETADAEDWNTSKRILCFVLAAPVIGVGVWLLQVGFGYEGTSLVIGLGILMAAGVVFVGALVLVAIGLLGLPSGTGAKGVDPLEEEAERRGMPTDPEAYQDGGVGVAATWRTTTEAELIAAELNARDIPAWADQAYASTVLSHAQFALNPDGVRVLVPLGRLADAQEVLADRETHRGDAEEDDEQDEEQRRKPKARIPPARKVAAILLLCMGVSVLIVTALPLVSQLEDGLTLPHGLAALVSVAIYGSLCVLGLLALRRRRDSDQDV